MANGKTKTNIYVLRGEVLYAKVLGEPLLNFNEDGKEWTFDFVPNEPKKAAKILDDEGIGDRIKKKTKAKYPAADGRQYIGFKQKYEKADGGTNDPITVVDAAGRPWPEDKLIGNGSVVDVKFAVIDFGSNRFKGMYPRAIRVLEHVPYEGGGFEPLSEDDEYAQAAREAEEAMNEDSPEEENPFADLESDLTVE